MSTATPAVAQGVHKRGHLMALLIRGIRMLQLAAIVLFLVITTSHTARAHIEIISPNGGETLTGPETHVIEWEILESHVFLSWDIWYSVNGLTGPWFPIAAGLPPGTVLHAALEWNMGNGMPVAGPSGGDDDEEDDDEEDDD